MQKLNTAKETTGLNSGATQLAKKGMQDKEVCHDTL